MPKIGIIIPVYGVEKYIERCARSLFEQTLDDIEYLFVDDCTPDHSIDILQRVLEDYPNRKHQVRIHKMEKNSGQAAVREWGMRHSQGDYLIHCDTDDWLERDAYRLMYETAYHDDADIVVCDYYFADGNNIRLRKGCLDTNPEKYLRDCCTLHCGWQLWNKLIKRSLVSEIDYPKANMGEDMAIFLQSLLGANKISYVNKPLYYYYINPCSITKASEEDKVLSRSEQFVDNVTLFLKALKRKRHLDDYYDEIIYLKWTSKKNLWLLTDKNKYFEKWKQMWPEINRMIFNNKYISRGEKIKFALTFLRIYPFLPKCYRRVVKRIK